MFSPWKKIFLSTLIGISVAGSSIQTDDTSVVLAPQPVLQPKESLCNVIASHNLQSIPQVVPPFLANAATDPYAGYKFITQAISNPQPVDKRRRAFTILANAEKKKLLENPQTTGIAESIIDQTTWQDLNLLIGSKENPTLSLVKILTEGRTHTDLGKAYLAGLIARPTADSKAFLGRQEFIRELVNNDALREKLDTYLAQIGSAEGYLTGLWDIEMLMHFVEMNYSKLAGIGPKLNENSLVLELKSLAKLGGLGVAGSILTISPVVLSIYGLSQLIRNQPALEGPANACMGQFGMIFQAFPGLKNRWALGLTALGLAGLSALAFKQSMQGFHTIVLLDSFLRQRLVHISMYDEAACNIATLLKNQSMLSSHNLTFSDDLEKFYTKQIHEDDQLNKLVQLLQSNTFEKGTQDETQFFFSRGNTLAAYYLMTQAKNKFECLMAHLGELDALLTIAKLVKQSSQGKAPWCFVSYDLQASNPTIELTDFWNPFIDPETVVLNSIALGVNHGIPNIITTGPNSSGKSTVLKSVALSIILAQSVGVAPARSMTLTPYAHLVTYMNVADSIVDKESRFQAEARRVFEYGDNLEKLSNENKFSFAIFDEVFSGTSPKEGAELGFKVANIFGYYQNFTGLIATHFDLLTTLEQETKGQFVNFKVSVAQNADGSIRFDESGKIERNYKLTRGISTQHIAREVFKERGESTHSAFFNKCFNEQAAAAAA